MVHMTSFLHNFFLEAHITSKDKSKTTIPLTAVDGNVGGDIPSIYDDDDIYFILKSKDLEADKVSLWIGDLSFIGVPISEIEHKFYIDKKAFFNGFCGICKVSLVVTSGVITNELRYIIEVKSRKVDKEFVLDILEYLIKKVDGFNLSASESVMFAEYNGYMKSFLKINLVINRVVSDFINYINRCGVQNLIISRLKNEVDIVNFNKVSGASSSSILWLCQNANEIACSNSGNIRIRNKPYTIRRMLNENLKNDFDVYENRILVGFIESMLRALTSIKADYKLKVEELKKVTTNYQISSFVYIYKEYLINSYNHQVKEISNNFDKLIKLRNIMQTLPSFHNLSPLWEYPKTTLLFKKDKNLRNLYPVLVRWWKIINEDQEKYDNYIPLENTDQLYEYFCLFKIFDSINAILAIKENYENAISLFSSKSFSWKISDVEKIVLFYEPKISRNIGKNIKLKKVILSQNEEFDYYTPDFVIKYSYYDSDSYMILDAKFTTSNMINDVVKKYYLGLSNEINNRDNIFCVSTIQPIFAKDEAVNYISFYDKDIFSKDYILPDMSKLFLTNVDEKDIVIRYTKRFMDITKEMYNEKINRNSFKTRRNTSYKSSSKITYEDAAVIKGMINRGDSLQDIAFWFGVNIGRISEINNGDKFYDVNAENLTNLPPKGPYLSLSEIHKRDLDKRVQK